WQLLREGWWAGRNTADPDAAERRGSFVRGRLLDAEPNSCIPHVCVLPRHSGYRVSNSDRTAIRYGLARHRFACRFAVTVSYDWSCRGFQNEQTSTKGGLQFESSRVHRPGYRPLEESRRNQSELQAGRRIVRDSGHQSRRICFRVEYSE